MEENNNTDGGMTAFPKVEAEGFALRLRIAEQILANSQGRHLTHGERALLRQVMADKKAACIRARVHPACPNSNQSDSNLH